MKSILNFPSVRIVLVTVIIYLLLVTTGAVIGKYLHFILLLPVAAFSGPFLDLGIPIPISTMVLIGCLLFIAVTLMVIGIAYRVKIWGQALTVIGIYLWAFVNFFRLATQY